MTSRDHYLAALVARAESELERPLAGRTVACADPERVDSRSATSYPMPAGTVVWCDPALVDRITQLFDQCGDTAITSERWVELATEVGAEHLGSGNNRVLVGDVTEQKGSSDGVDARVLDTDDDADLAALRAFVDAASEVDLDDAEIDLDDPDPFIVGLFERERMVAYGGGRPYDDIPEFDDIGVLTSPSHRRRGFGARVVAEFVHGRTARDPSRRMLYRCDTENAGSNAVAESLGFLLVHTIGAVRLPK